MRLLKYLINDVREQTDNEDVNGVSDKEIIRYFQDCIKSIQTIVFKSSPTCAYFQKTYEISGPINGKSFPLPSDVYADNKVTMVETTIDNTEYWRTLKNGWAEEQHYLFGWYVRNKEIHFSGTPYDDTTRKARVTYYYKLKRWDKVWAEVDSIVGQTIKIVNFDKDLFDVDNTISIFSDEDTKVGTFKYKKVADDEIEVVGDISVVTPGSFILMGDSELHINLPDEVETYILDYVSKRIFSRNNYTLDTNKVDFFTQEARNDIVSIFADSKNTMIAPPIMDTDYLSI